MATHAARRIGWHSPVGTLGRLTISGIAYLGGVGILLGSAVRSVVFPRGAGPAFWPALLWQLSRLFGMGLPLVGVVHIALGSFLSMQAYFGGTFVDGTGAVVGVGLIRNVAPLMAGFILAGLLAARIVPELRGRARRSSEDSSVPVPDFGRLAAVRITASLVAGPVLGFWGSVVGGLVGWQVASTLLGVSTYSYTQMFVDMIWLRDIVGLVAKGMLFGLLAALFACYEGLRDGDPDTVPGAAVRATCFASLAIMMVNSAWFLLVYHAGPPFGPTLLAPPTL